jgi:cytochrome c biogenesis protein CcmG/thiol:disulfide interchange protein DsbE
MKTILLSVTLALLAPLANAAPPKAADFTLADAAGNTVNLPRKHEGVDVYLFWASWCPYCKALMPHLQSMRIEYGDAVTIYALNISDDKDPRVFMEETGYDFTLLPDADPVMRLYGVRPTPALFLVDGQGLIRFNLYETIFDNSNEPESISHRKKAARRAPYWSAEIRRKIDQILAEAESGGANN